MRLSGEWIYRKQGWNDLPDAAEGPDLAPHRIRRRRLRRARSSSSRSSSAASPSVGCATARAAQVCSRRRWSSLSSRSRLCRRGLGDDGQAGTTPRPLRAAAASQTSAAAVTVTATEFKFALSKVERPARQSSSPSSTRQARTRLLDRRQVDAPGAPGKRAKLTVDLTAGKHLYVCTVPGHAMPE